MAQQAANGTLPASSEADDLDARIEAAAKENAKLRYRLNIMKRALERSGGDGAPAKKVDPSSFDYESRPDAMDNIIRWLEAVFSRAVFESFPALPGHVRAAIMPAAKAQFGDYQFNSAMSIAKVRIISTS